MAATFQCFKTCEESCQQKSQPRSFGPVSEFFKGHRNHSFEGTKTEYSSQTKVLSPSRHFTTIAQTQTNKKSHELRREHKRGLKKKIKYRSGYHNNGDTTSDTDDNDNNDDKKWEDYENWDWDRDGDMYQFAGLEMSSI